MSEKINFSDKLSELHGKVLIASNCNKEGKFNQKTELNDYREFLNSAFYPKVGDSKYTKELQKALSEKVEELVKKRGFIINKNFEPVATKAKITWKEIENLIKEENDEQKEWCKSEAITLQQLLNKAKALIENESFNGVKIAKSVKKRIETCYNYLKTLQWKKQLGKKNDESKPLIEAIEELAKKESKRFITKQRIKGEDTNKALTTIQFFIDILNTIATPSQLGDFSMDIKGKALEVLLQGIADEYVELLKNNQTSNLFKEITSENIQTKIEQRTSGTPGSQSQKETDSETITIGNTKIKIQSDFNPYKDRQGKMDVEMVSTTNIPETKNSSIDFRISAKNWSNFSDFGETWYIYGIIRSLQEFDNSGKVLDSFISQLHDYYSNTEESKINVKEIHNIAKYSLAIDILMGYSQKQQSANIVVINLQGKEFIVFSIGEVFQKIYENLMQQKSTFTLKNYPTDSEFKKIFEDNNDLGMVLKGLKFKSKEINKETGEEINKEVGKIMLTYSNIKQFI